MLWKVIAKKCYLLIFFFIYKVHLGCVYSGLVISREAFCFNELLWFEYFFVIIK